MKNNYQIIKRNNNLKNKGQGSRWLHLSILDGKFGFGYFSKFGSLVFYKEDFFFNKGGFEKLEENLLHYVCEKIYKRIFKYYDSKSKNYIYNILNILYNILSL